MRDNFSTIQQLYQSKKQKLKNRLISCFSFIAILSCIQFSIPVLEYQNSIHIPIASEPVPRLEEFRDAASRDSSDRLPLVAIKKEEDY